MSILTDENMGLPRMTGKRKWSEETNGEDSVSCKVLCTSPPHAICADDIMQATPADSFTRVSNLSPDHSDPEDEPFVDDEEDKDSGFIDGNSIDNSSDDDIQSGSSPEAPLPQQTTSEFLVTMDVDETPSDATSHTQTSSYSDSISSPMFSVENEITTVTCALSGAAISSSNANSTHQQMPYTSENYSNRSPSWSCNFYDGSNPNPNKYMEISPSRGPTSQSIQCDENGKSYMELGSASLYTNTYANDTSNFTTAPSTYHTSTLPPPSPYPQATSPFYSSQPRQPYNNFSYPQAESPTYCTYENDHSYNYPNGTYNRATPLNRLPQRCTSPYCDPTKTKPRPPCYQQQRLSIFNMSMHKLNRFTRYPEPSLHRSVLICNTLRHIEKELENEGITMTSVINHNQPPSSPPVLVPADSMPSTAAHEEPLPSMLSGDHPFSAPSSPAPVQAPPYNTVPMASPHPFYSSVSEPKESSMRPYDHEVVHHQSSSDSQQAAASHADEASWSPRLSAAPGEEKTESINWCSVLLSSQSDMDSVNNNECSPWSEQASHSRPAAKLPSLSVEDVLKSFPEGNRRHETPPAAAAVDDIIS